MDSDDLDLDFFARLLEERRRELLELSDERDRAEATVELDQQRVGRLSRMDALQQQAMAKASGQRTKLELQRIASAMARIESGDFGYCLECGESVAPARLNIEPTATLCMACATKAEQ